jgi:hypothetical protein
MISVVNGYVCNCSCDVEKAKQGKDPSSPPGTAPGSSSKSDKKFGLVGQPATILDGVLKDSLTSSAVTAATNTTRSTGSQQPSVNLLA